MAEGKQFVCSHCRYAIEARDEGNPYFLSDNGRPQLFYHPVGGQLLEDYIQNSEGRFLTGKERKDFLIKRTGNMTNILCLDCGSKFKRDLEEQDAVCPRRKCKSKKVVATWKLEGKTCPSCKTGRFKGELMDGS